jgi:hypothetical protein
MLHHKQHIGPVDQPLINMYAGIVVCPRRAGYVDRMVFKQQFSGRATPLVLTANEKEIRQGCCFPV